MRNAAMEPFQDLVGEWTTEATHPAIPGVTVHGTATVSWLDGEHFLLLRARTDHPQFPGSTVVLGDMRDDRVDDATGKRAHADGPARLTLHYYDSRGVFRDYETSMTGRVWTYANQAPGFSQRFTGTLSDDGRTLDGLSQLCRDGVHWEDDLRITYRRA